MFLRDDNLNYEALRPNMPHHDNSVAERAKNAARCLDMVRQAIARSQKKTQDRENVTQKATIDVGDIVFARTVYTGRRDTKLLAPFHGPFRVLELKGNTCVLKSFITNRMSAVSLRNVKLVCPHGFSQTEPGRIFPDFLNDNADFLDTEISQSPHIVRVRSHADLSAADFDAAPDAASDLHDNSAENSTLPASCQGASGGGQPPQAAASAGQPPRAAAREKARGSKAVNHDTASWFSSVASRTRARTAAAQIASICWIQEAVKDFTEGQELTDFSE